ncbi:MAG: hypothetical protein Q7S47_02430 [bacterium]|nr:hypothetical protein [bacterium]
MLPRGGFIQILIAIFVGLLVVGGGGYVGVKVYRQNKETERVQECRSYGVTAKANLNFDIVPVTAHYVYYSTEDRCVYETYYVINQFSTILESGEMTDLFTGELILNFAYSSSLGGLIDGNARNCKEYEALRMRYFGEGLQYCK